MWKPQGSPNEMKHLLLLGSLLAASALSAGDAVGWMRVSVPSNDVVGVLLPFSPLGASGVGSLLFGPFVGDGGEDSDRLVVVSMPDAVQTSLVHSADGWLDPTTGAASSVSANPGDALMLDPCGVQPFEFYLAGRFAMPENAYARNVQSEVTLDDLFKE